MAEWLSELIQHFHFQRPWWLLGIPITALAIAVLWRRHASSSSWQQLIAPELLQHLMHGKTQHLSRAPLLGLGILWLLACLAIAGPSWEKIPQPIHKSEQALVVLLDLSPSMLAQDLKPSRLVRARLKLIDFLNQREEGLTALIAFAGESHVITPLTDDTRTITALVPALSPNVMPLAGSNPEMAVQQAVELLNDAGISRGELLLITDGVDTSAIGTIEQTLGSNHQLSILGVGTEAGAPIPISSGGFAKDKNGGMILARLNSGQLQQLSRTQNGQYRTLAATNTDIDALAQTPSILDDDNTREVNREFDLWLDRGPWLALLMLPLLLLGFRRGWLLSLLLVTLPNPQPAMALEWQDLWQTGDQQGQVLLESGDASAAAQKFDDSQWAGSAHYQAGEYDDAIASFSEQDTAAAHYNRGNALAKSGRLEEALEAYQQALEQDADFPDAEHNQKIVEEALKEQQQKQKQQQDQSGDQGDSQDQSQQGSQSDQHNGDNQPQSQKQQSKGQQSQEGQSESQPNSENSQQQSDSNSDKQSAEQQTEQNQDAKPDTQPSEDSAQQNQGQKSENDTEGEGENESPGQPQSLDESELTPEQKEQLQAMEQWLRKVPDDPSGLMRKKFEHQYNQRRLQYQQGTWEPPENNALERW